MIRSGIICGTCYGNPNKTFSNGFKRDKVVCVKDYDRTSLSLYYPTMMERFFHSYDAECGYIKLETSSSQEEMFFCSLLCLDRHLTISKHGSVLHLIEGMNDFDKTGILEEYRIQATIYNAKHKPTIFHKHFLLTLEMEKKSEDESEDNDIDEYEDNAEKLLTEIKELKEMLILREEENTKEMKRIMNTQFRSENTRLTEELKACQEENMKLKEFIKINEKKKEKDFEKLKEKDREIFRLTTRIIELERNKE